MAEKQDTEGIVRAIKSMTQKKYSSAGKDTSWTVGRQCLHGTIETGLSAEELTAT